MPRYDHKEVRKTAESHFTSGFYCAESVVLALLAPLKLDSDLLPRMGTGFCAGMARTCGPCGALTGAVIGLGAVLGRSRPSESAEAAYMATQRLTREFAGEFGARDCDRLLACDLGTPEGQALFRERRLWERCARYTGRAAEAEAAPAGTGD